MTQLFPVLIALACPLGMAAMMAVPALGRRFARRADTTAVEDETSQPNDRLDASRLRPVAAGRTQ